MKLGCVIHKGTMAPVARVHGRLVNLQKVADVVAPGSRFPTGVEMVKRLMAPDASFSTVIEVLRSLKTSCPSRFFQSETGLQWLPPVHDARQVICVGLNYRSHCAEQNVPEPVEPRFFSKLVSSMTGHLRPVSLWPVTNAIDYEGELAIVIGKTTFRVPESRALSCVAGYTILNDVSARDLQESDRQWMRAKSLDGFCPCGPFLTTADEIPDPDSLRITTTVNNEVRQDCPTSDMIFNAAAIISRLSQAITLQPGDIIATGTPAGVGKFRDPRGYLSHGDTVSITIDGLGTLTNTFNGVE
ncbi:MAG TPA: fumarylacetoacetate hydrolase family protein [Myxococcota bacterium]|nr:fumarylacetoacetate hydrolase family protein [Myxococcota bacterium]